MDANAIIQMVGSLGFPIVACIAMGWYVKYQTDQNNKEVKEMRDEHRKEIEKVTEALNNNTLAIQKLSDHLDENSCIIKK